jgi:hypothetical protein
MKKEALAPHRDSGAGGQGPVADASHSPGQTTGNDAGGAV